MRVIPKHGDYTPSASIERGASAPIESLNAASSVASGSASALTAKKSPAEVRTGLCVALGLASSMEGDLVRLTIVDVLDNIDLEKTVSEGSAGLETDPQ